MITRHRHIFTIIYFVVSSSIIYPAHCTQGKEKVQNNIDINVNKLADVEPNSIQNFKSQSSVITQQTDRDLSEITNEQWSKVGIFATSILFLFMVFILFKEEKDGSAESKKSFDILDDRDRQNHKITKESSIVIPEKLHESFEKSSFMMMGINLEEEFDNDLLLNKDSIVDKKNSIPKPEMKTSETSKNTFFYNDADIIVDSDIMGQLTITTADSTETKIDVVLELIQDLHQSDRIENTNITKDLRRKAIWELGYSNDCRAVEPLIKTIPKVDSLEKSLIFEAIDRIANRSFNSVHHAQLTSSQDDDPEVRKNAIQDLTNLYQSVSFVTIRLSKMVDDDELEIQQTAQWALEKFNEISDAAASRDSSIRIDSNSSAHGSNDNSHHSI